MKSQVIFLPGAVTPKGRGFHPKRVALGWRKKNRSYALFQGEIKKLLSNPFRSLFASKFDNKKGGG
jgi:hypothetical protein